jgi:hypothetical protein
MFHFGLQRLAININQDMVAREGLEPPPQAFSGLALMSICNNLTGLRWLRKYFKSRSQAATRVANPKEITLAKRTRYQYGRVEINKRVTGPDVWLYLWWEPTSDGRRTRRGFTVGTIEQYKTEAHALKAAEGRAAN